MSGNNAIFNGKATRTITNHLYIILLIPLVFIAYSLLSVPGIPIGNGDLPYIETSLYGFKKIWTWTEYASNHNMEYLPRYPILGLWLASQALHISVDLAGKALIISGFFIASFSFYFSSLKFFKSKLDTEGLSFKIATVLGALFYAYNVWSFHRIGHWYFWIGYGFLPIFFVTVIYSLRNPKKLQYIVASVLLWSIASSTPHMAIFYGMIFVTLSIILIIGRIKANQESVIQLIRPILLIISIFILVNMYWIYPYIGSSSSDTFLWRTVVTEESTRDLSSDSYPLNVLRLLESTYNMGTINVVPSSESQFYPVWIFASFVIPIFAFSSLFWKKRTLKYALLFSILSILGLLLVTGNKVPFNLYTTLLFYTPLISSLQMLFREPDKWAFLAAFGYSFLIVMTSFNSSNRLKKVKYGKLYSMSLSLFILACIVIYFYPAYKDSMENLYHPVVLPPELGQLDKLGPIINDKVFIMPTIPPYQVFDTTWGKDKRTESLHPYASPVPNIAPSDYNNVEKYNRLLVNLITANKTDNISDIIYPMGASYLLYHNDTLAPNNNQLLDSISSLSGVKNLENIGIFKIFKIGDAKKVEEVSIPPHSSLITGGLDKIGSLNFLHSLNLTNSSLLYLDQFLKDSNSYPPIFDSDYAFLGRNENDFVLSFVDSQYIIAPFDETYHHDPGAYWSKTGTNDPGNAHFTPLLESLGISNWDFDYGKGLVMTTASGTKLSMPVSIEHGENQSGKSDELSLYMRYLENQKGGLIRVYFDGRLVAVVDTFDKISNNFVWKKIALLNLTTEQEKEKHTLTIENVDGFNAVNVFALVPQNEMNRLIKQTDNLLDDKTRAIYLMEAESNFYNKGVDNGFQNLFIVGGNNNGNNTSNNGNNTSNNNNNTLSGNTVPTDISSIAKTFKGQFTVPPNTDTATLQFLTTPNPTKANSTYLIKNLEIIPRSRNIPVLESDCNRDNHAISDSVVVPVGDLTQINWINYQPDILSTSIETKQNAIPTLGTLGNNTINNTLVKNTIGNAIAVDKSLKVDIKQGNFSYWGILSTDFIPADESSCYNFSLDISTESVTQLHSKVFYYDSNKKEIKWDFVFGGQDGSFEQVYDKPLSSPPGTKYMKLQMWVSPNSEMHSSYVLKDVILNEIIPPTVVTFKSNYTNIENLNSTGQYLISLNNKDRDYTEVSNEGANTTTIKVTFDKNTLHKTYSIQTKPFSVKENQIYNYTTTIDAENVNSISVIASFKNDSDVVVSNRYGSNASNGNVLSMGNGSQLSSKLDIIKPSNYAIALRAKTCETCTFIRVSITPESESGVTNNNTSINNTNPLSLPPNNISLKDNDSSLALKWLYSNNTYLLKRGTYELKVYSDSKTDLDSVILYSTNSSAGLNNSRQATSLEDVFSPPSSPPAQIGYYKKINPTKYILDIKNATRPYTISFAESYDPLWIAYSDTNKNDSNDHIQNSNENDGPFKTSSIPLYSIVNGFFINKTGDYSITIEYKPQNWFIQGGIVSIITVIAIFVIYFLRHKITTAHLKRITNRNHASKRKR